MHLCVMCALINFFQITWPERSPDGLGFDNSYHKSSPQCVRLAGLFRHVSPFPWSLKTWKKIKNLNNWKYLRIVLDVCWSTSAVASSCTSALSQDRIPKLPSTLSATDFSAIRSWMFMARRYTALQHSQVLFFSGRFGWACLEEAHTHHAPTCCEEEGEYSSQSHTLNTRYTPL